MAPQGQNDTKRPPLIVSGGGLLSVPAQYRGHVKGLAAVAVAILSVAPWRVLGAIWNLAWMTLGITIGVGFGLGLAMHVYEQLQRWNREDDAETNAKSIPGLSLESIRPKSHILSKAQSNVLEDSSSYFAMMALAGYTVPDKVLRGQVLPCDSSFFKIRYPFTDVQITEQIGPCLLRDDWPRLPEPVTRELGRFIEHVMRDYIAGWYCKLDYGCVYTDERGKRAAGIERDGTIREDATKADHDTQRSTASTSSRRMVYSTLSHRTIPFLDQTYRVLSAAFGSLATRAEHVNIFSLALLKWTQVLAQTLKQYRHLRKIAQQKNETENPREVQIVREFLLAGKLHKAVTFGLDVPALLFADAHGVECGTAVRDSPDADRSPRDATQVLEERLFGSPALLKECELDYNRCLAFRLVRALLPKHESNSQVVMALVTEIFGACVLQPIMNLWVPSFLNEIIVNATGTTDESTGDENTQSNESDEGTTSAATPATKSQTTDTTRSGSRKAVPTTAIHANSVPSSNGGSLNRTESGSNGSIAATSVSTQSRPRTRTNSADTGFGDDGAMEQQGNTTSRSRKAIGTLLLKVTAMAISKVEGQIPLEDCRVARRNGQGNTLVDYDDPDCQQAVIRLVLVMEAALLHGRCAVRGRKRRQLTVPNEESDDDEPDGSFLQVLMELTSDMDAFEKRIRIAQAQELPELVEAADSVVDFVPDPNELSTIRTLVSTWLHTASLPRAMGLVIQGMQSVLRSFYSDDAFLADSKLAQDFQDLIRIFEGVDIMVETMATLASRRLDIGVEALSVSADESNQKSSDDLRGLNVSTLAGDLMAQSSYVGFSSTPRFLDFHKNAAFSASLRSERERRVRSWECQRFDEGVQTVHRPGASQSEVELHRELHSLATMFYNGTNLISIRDAARKADSTEKETTAGPAAESEKGKVSLITVETVSNRRRIEVPDDDSSFLLRAQPRQLNPVSIHRDDRNHDLSYKCFLATYEEPVVPNASARGNPGKFVRRVWIQYYPIDRTATVLLNNDTYARKLDRRKGKSFRQDSTSSQVTSSTSGSFLSGAFLRERHLCQKPLKGATSQSFLSSSVVESADFVANPRNGKALDFVYRMSLFEKPVIDLAGKQFTIHDSAARGHHRADASALEVSDASLTAILYSIGKESGRDVATSDVADYRHKVEMGPDGYPIIFMKFNNGTADDTNTEIKPYRVSFVRAALMVTSARQEAQLQCLTDCVKTGSAKSATKARTDAQLRPTLKILDFANDNNGDRLKESALLRDLKIGVCHIDREQLRRNGLLNPRYPTQIRELSVSVEEALPASSVPELFNSLIPATTTLYRLRCSAVVELAEVIDDESEANSYLCEGEKLAGTYKEEWVVYRSMKDFQALHKQLKSEVAAAESSISTGSRIVGVAAAAFSTAASDRRSRKAMIPSLAQASKTGAIAVTQKAIARRGELLGEYLDYILSPNHILNRCTEILLFIGALYPFPSEIQVTKTPLRLAGDPLGRTSFTRTALSVRISTESPFRRPSGLPQSQASGTGHQDRVNSSGRRSSELTALDDSSGMIESILIKVDAVRLADVRNRLVELVKFQFGFENASFFRSRLLSALETASFMAMTKNSDFRKFLYKTHVEQLNPDAIGKLVEKLLDMLWPDGCWLISRPAFTADEEVGLMEASRQQLHKVFPEQIRTILGRELTRDGLDIVHEMLQNRMVVKSLFYTLFDLLWVEIFPELRDAIGSSTFDSD